MEKISPLKASLETFKQFRAQRSEKVEEKKAHSNPFGITFKGTMLNMDVFESNKKVEKNSFQESMGNITKFVASARVSALNSYSKAKEAVLSFTGKIKQNTKAMVETLKNPETYAVFTTPSVTSLSKLPVSDLEVMLKNELAAKAV